VPFASLRPFTLTARFWQTLLLFLIAVS